MLKNMSNTLNDTHREIEFVQEFQYKNLLKKQNLDCSGLFDIFTIV